MFDAISGCTWPYVGEIFMNYAARFKVLPLIRSLDVVRMETMGLCVTRNGHFRLMNERLKVYR